MVHLSYIQAKPESSHTDVNDALRKINHHLAQNFARDFPFYLVLAYTIYRWGRQLLTVAITCYWQSIYFKTCLCASSYESGSLLRKPKIYQCEEFSVFIKSCIEKMESTAPHLVASTFLGFLNRWIYNVHSLACKSWWHIGLKHWHMSYQNAVSESSHTCRLASSALVWMSNHDQCSR